VAVRAGTVAVVVEEAVPGADPDRPVATDVADALAVGEPEVI
jgi:hypothetical protein